MRHLLLACCALALTTPAHSAAFIRLIPFTNTTDLVDTFGGRSYRTAPRAVTGQPFSNGSAPGILATRQQSFQTAANACVYNNVPPAVPVFEIAGLPGDLGLDVALTNQNVIARSLRPGGAGNCYITFQNWAAPLPLSRLNGSLNVNINPTNIFYFGMTWGSVDEYNVLSILPRAPIDPNDPEDVLFAQAADGTIIGQFPTKFVTGAELATAFGVPLYGDYYVEIRADAALGQIRLLTTNLAFEIDGLVAGATNVRNYGCIYAANPGPVAVGSARPTIWSPACANTAPVPVRGTLPAPLNVKTLPGAPGYVYDSVNPVIDYYYNSGGGIRPGGTANQVVPAPAALAMFGFGFAGLFAARRRAR